MIHTPPVKKTITTSNKTPSVLFISSPFKMVILLVAVNQQDSYALLFRLPANVALAVDAPRFEPGT